MPSSNIWLCDSCGAKAVKAGECKALYAYYPANEIPFLQGTCARCPYFGNLMPYPIEAPKTEHMRNESLLINDLKSIYRRIGKEIHDKEEVASILSTRGYFSSAEAVARTSQEDYEKFLTSHVME